jgi:aspartyl-tRNA(Asn)/glutamyl-tRNA(Gln) amidotransferase subunit A
MKPNEMSIGEAHDALLRRKISCEELVNACLEAIKEKNAALNAFITVLDDSALLAAASNVDQRIQQGEDIPLLTGIPFSVKDAICTKGIRSTGSAKILDNYIPPYTATTVERVLKQGAILLGKTNCDAFGHGASNENSSYGPVCNPHDLTRVAGGSSGGSGAAVASGMGLFSIAEDTGGSVRCPAAFCGVTGLKVSYGRNSRFGAMPMASSLDTVGPIGKVVADVAIVAQIIAGKDPLDSTTLSSEVPDYEELLKKDISGMTAGVPREYFTDGVQKDVLASVLSAIEKLKTLGVKVEEVSLPMTKYAIATYYIIVPAEDSANLSRLDGIRYGVRSNEAKDLYETYSFSRRDGFPDEVKRRILIGTYVLSAGYYDAYYKKAQKVRTLIRQDFEGIFQKVNFLVTPTQPNTAFRIGEHTADPLTMYLQDVFVCPASVAGIPALSIPCGKDSNGLPVGLQIIGPSLREDRVLNVGYQLEQLLKKV